MSATGRDLRNSLNASAQTSEGSSNFMFYGVLGGIVAVAAIAFVVIGLGSGSSNDALIIADAPVEITETAEANTLSAEQLRVLRITEMKKYNQTISNITSCMRTRDQRKKFEQIKTSYEKRNADAVASWDHRSSKMLQKIENGDANGLDMAMWQASGNAQKELMGELSEQLAMSGSFKMMDENECMKFSGDVRLKKLDVEPHPQS